MTPAERVDAVMRSVYGSRWDDCQDQATVGAAFVQQIQLAVREAVAAEREACAKLADPHGGIRHLLPATPSQRERQSLIASVSRHIAAAIRARGEDVAADAGLIGYAEGRPCP